MHQYPYIPVEQHDVQSIQLEETNLLSLIFGNMYNFQSLYQHFNETIGFLPHYELISISEQAVCFYPESFLVLSWQQQQRTKNPKLDFVSTGLTGKKKELLFFNCLYPSVFFGAAGA
jgi:hypothetical protein